MEAWRQWLLGWRKIFVSEKRRRIHLTPTGLLMEGDVATLRFLFAFFSYANHRFIAQG